jgi:hypothetical protein
MIFHIDQASSRVGALQVFAQLHPVKRFIARLSTLDHTLKKLRRFAHAQKVRVRAFTPDVGAGRIFHTQVCRVDLLPHFA